MLNEAYEIIEGEYIGESTRVLSFPLVNKHAPFRQYFDYNRAYEMVMNHCKTLTSERVKDNKNADGLTMSIYKGDLRRFMAYLDRHERLPTEDVVLGYMGTLSHLNARTVNRYMASIRRFIRALALQPFELDEFDNPRIYMQCMEYQKSMQAALAIQAPHPIQSSQSALDAHGKRVSQEEALVILRSIDRSTLAGKRNYALAIVAFTTSLRVNALTRITLDSLRQHRHNTWTIQVKDKRGKFDPIAIDAVAVRAIQAYIEAHNAAFYHKDGTSHPITKIKPSDRIWRRIDRNDLPVNKTLTVSGVAAILQAVSAAGGIPLNAHDYRRSWALWAREIMDKKLAQLQMKHENFKVTEVYMGEERNYEGMNIANSKGFILWELAG